LSWATSSPRSGARAGVPDAPATCPRGDAPAYGCTGVSAVDPPVPRPLRPCLVVHRAQACTRTCTGHVPKRRGCQPPAPTHSLDTALRIKGEERGSRRVFLVASSRSHAVPSCRARPCSVRQRVERRRSPCHCHSRALSDPLFRCCTSSTSSLGRAKAYDDAPLPGLAELRQQNEPQRPPHRPSAAAARWPRLSPVQAPEWNLGEPLVTPHHFPGQSRRRARRILVLSAGHGTRGLHCFDFSLSREFSVIQGPLRNFGK
jgi:hypothetical protein